MSKEGSKEHLGPFRERIHEIIFEADTPIGKAFDIALLLFIIASVLVVMLESVQHLKIRYEFLFDLLEWIFTIFFTIEYILRLYSVLRPMKYATSFFGIIDLLAIVPTYISLFVVGAESLMAIRALRLLRIFRIFKLANFLNEGGVIIKALKNSRTKISVFLFAILIIVTVMGSIMYFIEGGTGSSFTSIPRSIYWAIVTLTTVGYGDISPVTSIGQFIAAIVMILGYAVIAVPTGIVTSELTQVKHKEEEEINTQACRFCSKEGHDSDAIFCKFCGEELNEK